MSFPRTLQWNGRRFSLAGPGRAAGSFRYMNVARGEDIEVFSGTVFQTGNLFALVALKGNSAIAGVRVDHSLVNSPVPLATGDSLWLGGLEFPAAGPRARFAWKRGGNVVDVRRPERRPPRRRGRIDTVDGDTAIIVDEQDHTVVFLNIKDLRSGQFSPGFRLSFHVRKIGDRKEAVDAHAA